MPQYNVTLRPDITVTVSVEAKTEDDAREKWYEYGTALMEAKLAVAEQAPDLDAYEFDVETVELEGDEER